MTDDVFGGLKDRINKNIKGAHVSILDESDIASKRTWIKTPAYDLNRVLSGDLFKGIQSRNLVAIVGPEHTMKSSFMVLCMVEAQKSGLKPIIIDTEGGITSDFCERWGLDTKNILYIYTPWIHEVKSILAQIRESGEEGYIIGLDSVGGLDKIKSYEDALTGDPKADQGMLQKEIRSTLKLFLNICIAQNSIGICTGHLYGMPGGFMPMPDQIGGGKAMKLFPSVIIGLKKSNIVEGTKSDKRVIGSEIKATTLKNRLYPPFQEAIVKLNYIEGIDPFAGLIDLGIKAGIIEKSGSWFSMGEEKIGQGADNAMKTLTESGIGDKFLKKLNSWLSNTGYSSINKELKEAAEKIMSEEERVEIIEEKEEKEEKNPKKSKIKINKDK
jgi:recombination protein RecA